MGAVKEDKEKLQQIADKAEKQIGKIKVGDMRIIGNNINDFETAFLQLMEKKKGNAEQYKKEIEAAGGFECFQDVFLYRLIKLADNSIFASFQETMLETLQSIQQNPKFADLQSYIKKIEREKESYLNIAEENKALAPFIKELLEQNKENELYKNLDVYEVIKGATTKKPKGLMPAEVEACKKIFAEAKEMLTDYEAARDFIALIAETPPNLPIPTEKIKRITQSKSLSLALDPISTGGFWKTKNITPGQLEMYFPPKGETANTIKTISDFDSIPAEISRKLTGYDKYIYSVINTLFTNNKNNEGIAILTARGILKQAGIAEGSPSAAQVDKLIKSLKKMLSALITIDNGQEPNKPRFKMTDQLLKGGFIEGDFKTQGGKSDIIIRIDKEPILFEFARKRNKQITTVPRELIADMPISKTDQNLSIAQYLIERIAHMKNLKNPNNRILFESIFDNCEIDRNKARKKEDILAFLEHLKEQDFIKDFEVDSEKRHIDIIKNPRLFEQ